MSDARHILPAVVRLERGLATAKMLLQFGKTPAERAKAMKAIRHLSAQLAMARQGKGGV